jgi:rRNA maturation endonuclease Nob1
MPRSYYDDNFGTYDIRDDEDVEFYHRVQRESVWKICNDCGRRVKLRRDYGICNSCADKLERGYDLG